MLCRYVPVPNRLPIASPEIAETMPVLIASALKSDSIEHIQECLDEARKSHNRMNRPLGYCYWSEFLKAACDHSPEKLELMAQAVIMFFYRSVLRYYLSRDDFRYNIAGALLRKLGEDQIKELYEIHEAYDPTIIEDEVKHRRLTLLLYPEV